MDQAASQTAHGPADPVAQWVAELPPAPFVDSSGGVRPEALAVSLRNVGMGPIDG